MIQSIAIVSLFGAVLGEEFARHEVKIRSGWVQCACAFLPNALRGHRRAEDHLHKK